MVESPPKESLSVTVCAVVYVPVGTEKVGAGTCPPTVTATTTCVVCEIPPLVPVITKGTVDPIGPAVPFTETVNWDEPAPGIELGMRLPVMVVMPIITLPAVRVTGESKPPAAMTEIVVVPVVVAPAVSLMVMGLGEAISSKEGVGAGVVGWYTQRSLRSLGFIPGQP
jgi:hypothetical protein